MLGVKITSMQSINPLQVSKRGTVASRPGNPSPKDMQKQQSLLQSVQDPALLEDPSAETAAVPAVVTNRMLQRMLIFAGLPVFFGILLFPVFYYLKVMSSTQSHTCSKSLCMWVKLRHVM